MRIERIHKELLAGRAVVLTVSLLRGYTSGAKRSLRLHPRRYTPKGPRTLADCYAELKRDLANFKRDESPWEKPTYAVREDLAAVFPELVGR